MQNSKPDNLRLRARSRPSAPVPAIGAMDGVDRRSALSLITAMIAGAVAGVARPQVAWSQATVGNVQLSRGVIVDLDHNQAYIVLPDGGIAAVDLAQGNEVWRSSEADKPLTVAGDLLISQGEPRTSGNELRILALNVRDGGRVALEKSVELPAGVKTSTMRSRTSSFDAAARIVAGNLAVSWQYESTERPLQGVRPEPTDAPPDPRGRAKRPTEIRVSNGTFRLDLQSGDVSGQQLNIPFTPPQIGRAVDLRGGARIAGVPQTQFLSVDGRYVLSPERVADDPEFEKYRWTIYDRGTAERVGEFRTHARYAPFVVVDSRLIYEVTPYLRQTPTGIVEEPLQVRAVDLRTGAVLWRQPVRDFTDRQPPPP
jgi:hypothetical protein